MSVVLLISGSTRSASTNTSALRTVAAIAPAGIKTPWYDGLADLPAFNAKLVEEIAEGRHRG